ncbi:MAG: domain 2 [Verrucomicrobiota bacterium]
MLDSGRGMFHDQAMTEQWIIQVEGKDYGPADLDTLREWKTDGRVLPANPARPVDVDLWKTAADIPGLFHVEAPPVQVEAENEQSETRDHKVESKPPTRNILVETFRIYFRGFFQFFCLSLLSIVPVLCAELTSRFIDTAPGVNVDLRTLVIVAFGLCMLILRIVLIPVYIAGIQILTAELATGHRVGFFSALNGAVKYWPRVAGLGLFVYGVFFLLILFALGIAIMVVTSSTVFSIVLALGLLTFQVWLFGRFFINVLFWQQFTVLENASATDALRESRNLARSGRDLPWYQRPMWRGAFIVSLWFAFALTITITPAWPMLREYFTELMRTQDPQALYQKMNASLQTHGFDYPALALNILQRILQPLLGIAFVVLYLDSKGDDHS